MSLNMHAGTLCFIVIILCAGIHYFNSDWASCVVNGTPKDSPADGYYFAYDGRYYRRGYWTGRSFLDIFDIVSLHGFRDRRNVIELGKNGWVVLDNIKQRVLYESIPNAKTDVNALYEPPQHGYMKIYYSDETNTPIRGEMAPTVQIQCTGKLYEARPVGPPTNLTTAFDQAGTYLVLIGLLYYAWQLRSNTVPVSDVSYSYDKVVNQGQYWRCITASISHFDMWHLGFNCFALYQMAIVEPVIGSVKYLYLSVNLVLLTMVVCSGIYYLMIFHANRPEQATAEAVGYSCVLFAWIVMVSVRMGQFCPIFFLPSFCFDTYQVPFIGMPFNLGPLVLLVITKFIIPRSSFVGHLSGIIVGLPLVWGWIDWLTPPILVSILLAMLLYSRNLDVRKYAGYSYGTQYQELSQTSSHQIPSAGMDNAGRGSHEGGAVNENGNEREFLEGFLSSEVVDRYMTLKKLSYSCVVWSAVVLLYAAGGGLVGAASSASTGVVSGWTQLIAVLGTVLTRALFAYLAWSASYAKRITLVSENSDTIKECILLLALTWAFSLFLFFFDLAALVLVVTCWYMVNTSVVGGSASLCVVIFFNAVFEALLYSAVMDNLRDTPPVERAEVLTQIRLNGVVVVED